MLEKISNYNKKMLIWAREESHIDILEVKNHFKDIEKWETGESFPNYSELKELAGYYKKPLAVFFFSKEPKLKSIQPLCRTIPSGVYDELSHKVITMINYARCMQLNLYELFDNYNEKKLFSVLSKDMSNEELRELLNLPLENQVKIKTNNELFNRLRDSFKELGIYVFKNAFHDDTVSGLCLYDDEFPVVLINNSASISRQCFTLLHELRHIMSKTSGLDFRNDDKIFENYENASTYEEELECNSFAANFLVPESDFRSKIAFIKINDVTIKSLAEHYKVSREVIVRRLFEMKKISFSAMQEYVQEFISDWRDRPTGKNSGGNYYATQSAYFGDYYLLRVFEGYFTNKINLRQVSNYLQMSITNASALSIYKGWGAL